MIEGATAPDPSGGMYALAATVVTSAAWYAVNRRTRTERATVNTLADAESDQAAAALVASATKLATTALTELAAVKATVEANAATIAELTQAVQACEDKHAHAESVLRGAGLID